MPVSGSTCEHQRLGLRAAATHTECRLCGYMLDSESPHDGTGQLVDGGAEHRLRQRQPRPQHRTQRRPRVRVRQDLVAYAQAQPSDDPAQYVLRARVRNT